MNRPFSSLYQTSHKINHLVLPPSKEGNDFDSRGVDCPFPFFHEGRYWMTYVGWDGVGYRTGLASSPDLEHWEKEGLILDRGPKGSPTEYNVALTSILRDNALYSTGSLRRVEGSFVGTYHAYPNPGYEEGPASIGFCTSDNLMDWQVSEPIFHPDPALAWEAGGLYKSWLMEHEGTYYLFYNAKTTGPFPWIEQTGVALSRDLLHWERSPLNPILPNGAPGSFDDWFASDPCVFRHEDRWIMFYFGNCSDGHAREGCAISIDLLHWNKSGEILIDVGPEGSIDARHAHKPGIIAKGGRLYHFYCAVGEGSQHGVEERRGITFARGEAT